MTNEERVEYDFLLSWFETPRSTTQINKDRLKRLKELTTKKLLDEIKLTKNK